MAEVFLFGSLRHGPLLDRVLDRPAPAGTRPARLADHRAVLTGVTDAQSDATLQAAPGETVEGLLVSGLSDVDLERLHFYTGVLGARAVDVAPDCPGRVEATAFVRDPDGADTSDAPTRAFDLAAWQAERAPLACFAAEEIMAQFGRWPAAAFGAHRLKAIETRAAARLRAPIRARPTRFDLGDDLELLDRRLPYLNFFSVAEVDLRHRLFDGRMSAPINRAALQVGDAAIVLPYDPRRDCVLLVQQFRAATYIAGDTAPWIWEAPAGLVDPGESPETAAHREAEEEAKLRLARLERVTAAYSSTGSSTEFSHIFVGIADLDGAGALAGLESEGEDIHSEVIPFDRFRADLEGGRFVNLQLVTAGLWLALNRARLRREG